jgi:hypothetical protein
MSDEKTDREIALAKLQYDHQLARFGLGGTLYGAFASLCAIVVIDLAQIITGKYIVDGWAFAGMVAVIVIPITFYGAFIFNRALSIEGKGVTFKSTAGE